MVCSLASLRTHEDRAVDSDGRSFVDWLGGGGPLPLGYRHPAVEDAIAAQLSAGPTLSLMHSLELDVAAQLTRMIRALKRSRSARTALTLLPLPFGSPAPRPAGK